MLPEPRRCDAASVQRYPTWVIGTTRYEGVMAVDELARASKFSPPSSR
ncbi:MAG: hypothetical protein HY216_06085 [Candidatus Rokubacteria bacterium]|nr:hypothetical protein [Candidatus Rokubacteria bacterium]